MLEFLYKFFIGHNHKWVQVERIMRATPRGESYHGGIGGIVYIMRCEVCGKTKQVDVY